jgi:hypothetical protein
MQTTRGLSMVIDRDVSGAVPTKKYKIPPRQALAPVPVQKAEAVYLIGLMRYFHRSLVEIDVWCLDVVTLLLGCKRSPKSLWKAAALRTTIPTTCIDTAKCKRVNSESGN